MTPSFLVFVPTYLLRSEHFLYRMVSGMHGIQTHVVAEDTAHLDEFPTPSVYPLRERWSPLQRVWSSLVSRFPGQAHNLLSLDRVVVRAMARHVRRLDPDLFFTHFAWHATELLDVIESVNSAKPFVFMVGGSDVTKAEAFGPGYVKRVNDCFQRADIVLCASEFLKRKAIEIGAPPSKLRVHYVGVPLPSKNQRNARGRRRFRLLAVSRLVEVKGLPHTLRAFAKVAEEVPEATLDVLGHGWQQDALEALAADLGVGARVRFLGEVDVAAVNRAMAEADLFVQHSIRTADGCEEGLGWSIVEAASHSLPVVATRSGGIPETVENGKTGLLVDPGNEDQMASAILDLYRNEGKRWEYGEAGRRRVEAEFDLAAQNRRLRTLLLAVSRGSTPYLP